MRHSNRATCREITSPSILGLDIQPTLLRQNQHVTVVVAERFVPHGLVGRVDMYSQPFSQNRRTGATQGLQTAHKVDARTFPRHREWTPCELSRGNLYTWVRERKLGF